MAGVKCSVKNMVIVQWCVFVLSSVVAIYVLLLNYYCVFVNYRNKKSGIDKHVSYIPFVAAVFALIATIASPMPLFKIGSGLFGAVFILDVGSSGMLVLLAVSGIRCVYSRIRT